MVFVSGIFLIIMERLVNTDETYFKGWSRTNPNRNMIISEQSETPESYKIDNDTNSQMVLVNPVGVDL